MMKSVLKTLVLSFGGGIALGAGIRLAQGPQKSKQEPGVDLDPLLDRLQNVESRIAGIETRPTARPGAEAPVEQRVRPMVERTLAAFESRLNAQIAGRVDQMRDEVSHINARLSEVDSQLPSIVQSTVDLRFVEVERKLQAEFEETQHRSMDAFVAALQSKVVERISTLESNLAGQSEALGKLRDASLKTDENLQKMLAGIERLIESRTPSRTRSEEGPPTADAPSQNPPERAAEASEPVNKPMAAAMEERLEQVPILAAVPEIHREIPEEKPLPAEPAVTEVVTDSAPAPVAETAAEPGAAAAVPPPQPSETQQEPEESYEWVNRIGLELLAPRQRQAPAWRTPVAIGLAAGLIIIAGLFYLGVPQRYFDAASARHSTTPAPVSEPVNAAAANGVDAKPAGQASATSGDSAGLVATARDYARKKDWVKAEANYRSALEASPENREAAMGLSDVLYQEQKYEESAAVLNKISSSSKSQ